MDINKICINKSQSIIEAINKIEKNKHKFIFIVDDKLTFLGIVNDGDIRRFIIANKNKLDLNIKIINLQKECKFLIANEFNFKNLSDIFMGDKIQIVPILDTNHKLINYITKDEFQSAVLYNKNLDVNFNFRKFKKHKAELDIYSRPWGFYKSILLTKMLQSKSITVFAHQSLSLQKHLKREEHWIIVYGKGKVILENSTLFVYPGKYIFIPKGCKHRIINTTNKNLIFFELQLGTYFGEDDIIRYEDQYNRR